MERGLSTFFAVRALETREWPFFFCRTAVRPAGPSKRSAAVALHGASRKRSHRGEQRGPRGGRPRRSRFYFLSLRALRPASLLLRFLFQALLFLLKALFFLTEPPRFAVLARAGGGGVAAATTHQSAATKYAVIRSNACSQPALADCTIMLHVVHRDCQQSSALKLGPTCAAVEMNSKRVEVLLLCTCIEAKRLRSRSRALGEEQYPHEAEPKRLVYA